jgi:hypothetical protein
MTAEAMRVSNLDDERLIREGEAAARSYARSGRESILPMARGLVAARLKYPSNQEFGCWFDQSPYAEVVTNHTMRAALIYLGEHDEIAAPIIQNCRTVDPVAIAAAVTAIAESFSQKVKTPRVPPSTPELPTAIARATEGAESPVPEAVPPTSISRRSPFYGLPRADEVAAIYLAKETRVDLGKLIKARGGKEVWSLVLAFIDAGFLTPTKLAFTKASLRILFPPADRAYCKRHDLTIARQREHVRDHILPAMIACRDKLLAAPERIGEILAEHENAQRADQRAAAHSVRRATAVKALPSIEQELVMFGQTVWPRLDNSQGEYDYDQVRAAVWTFRDYEAWNVLAQENTKSHAMRIRNSLRYFGEYVDRTDRNNPVRKIISLMLWFSYLMEKHPGAECKWPMYPHIEGQW